MAWRENSEEVQVYQLFLHKLQTIGRSDLYGIIVLLNIVHQGIRRPWSPFESNNLWGGRYHGDSEEASGAPKSHNRNKTACPCMVSLAPTFQQGSWTWLEKILRVIYLLSFQKKFEHMWWASVNLLQSSRGSSKGFHFFYFVLYLGYRRHNDRWDCLHGVFY